MSEAFEARMEREISTIRTFSAGSLEYHARFCESPIELLLLQEAVLWEWGFRGDYFSILGADVFNPDKRFRKRHGVVCYVQAPVLTYRADFLFDVLLPSREGRELYVVECDGHDFHEKTKAQVIRDKRRDRDMVAAGYRVLRYSGSEIYADPHYVWREIIDTVTKGEDQNGFARKPTKRAAL